MKALDIRAAPCRTDSGPVPGAGPPDRQQRLPRPRRPGRVPVPPGHRWPEAPFRPSSTSPTSTVLTSNKGFQEWGSVLGDEVMAAALIDRLLHHCHIVNIRGNSYRMREHQQWLRSAAEKRREGVAR